MKKNSSKTKSSSSKNGSRSNHNSNGSSSRSGFETNSDSGNDNSEGLRELFLNELKDIYWAENALVKALEEMAEKATSEELVEALNNHLEETEEQVERLEEVFEILGEEPKAKKCYAMKGLIEEARDLMEETEEGDVRDAAIISAAQKVEHYEIASYGTLRTFALTLGEDEAVDLLEETLNEEKAADETLTEIAEASINMEAAQS